MGAVVFPLAGAMLAGVAFAVTAYVSFLSSVHLTPMLLSLVLAAFLVVGALAAMLSASDPQWWKMNLSALGMSDEASALAFNLTLIIAGAMVTIIARYATASLPTTTREELRGRNLLRLGLILIGIFLACVGVFPVDEFFAVHNTVATGMAVIFAVLVIGLRWLVPAMPRVFVLLGYVFVGVIVLLGDVLRHRVLQPHGRRARRRRADLQLDHRVPAERREHATPARRPDGGDGRRAGHADGAGCRGIRPRSGVELGGLRRVRERLGLELVVLGLA